MKVLITEPLAEEGINILSAHVVLALHEPVSEERRQKLLAVPDVYSAKVVKL